jgi:hypothetical protein
MNMSHVSGWYGWHIIRVSITSFEILIKHIILTDEVVNHFFCLSNGYDDILNRILHLPFHTLNAYSAALHILECK